MGEFADAGEGVLFPLSLLEASTGREIEVPDDARVTLGVDVARSIAGDKNCVAVARAGKLQELVLWHSPDSMVTVSRVVITATKTGAKKLAVDVGGVGAGVVDRLRQIKGNVVEEVYFGGSAGDPQRFRNKRAEIFWTLRERMEKGEISLPEDEELLADLSALRYTFTQDGRIQLESKDEVRKRLGRSPDRADAVALAFAKWTEPCPLLIGTIPVSTDPYGVPMDGRWQPWQPGMR
jgi:hypothetical protein